jgi:hypothetical protein
MRYQRNSAEEELLKTTLSGDNVAIHGWIKKLGVGHHRTIDMDDESSWRDRLAFVVDDAMYYVSEKRRGERELVCHLDDIRHVEVGNGWPPGYFTFKIYIAQDDQNNIELSAVGLDSLPSRVFSTSTLEECRAWITVLSRGIDMEDLQESPINNRSGKMDRIKVKQPLQGNGSHSTVILLQKND